MKKIVVRVKNAPCMNRDLIHGPRHRSVDECQRIYAERQKGKEMDDWKNLNDERPCIGWIWDVLLPDGTVIENVEAVEVDDDNAFMPGVGFKKYPEATHFRKSK